MAFSIEEKVNNLFPTLKYKEGNLFIEDIPVKEIIEEFGTPVFIFSKNRILENLNKFTNTFLKYVNTLFFYPYRANYLPVILNLVHKREWGAEVASSFEYFLAKTVSAKRIILNGFDRSLYEDAINNENLFYINVNSIEDLRILNKLGEKNNKKIKVGLRVYPNLGNYQKYALIPRGFKLGYDIENGYAEKAIKIASNLKYIDLVALSTHIGIKQTNSSLHVTALKSLLNFSEKIAKKYENIKIEYINLGGGFETRNLLERSNSLEEFAVEFKNVLSLFKKEYKLILEPGRYIINDTGIVLTKIVSIKENNGKKWIITDIGVNTLIPLKSASFDIIPCEYKKEELDIFNVGDFTPSPIGIIKEKANLPKNLKIGDCLAIINAGAYTLSMAEQFVLLRPKVIFIDEKGKIMLVKEEEKVNDAINRLQSSKW